MTTVYEEVPKNPKCPLEKGSMACLSVTWADGQVNYCQNCAWWDRVCEETEEEYD